MSVPDLTPHPNAAAESFFNNFGQAMLHLLWDNLALLLGLFTAWLCFTFAMAWFRKMRAGDGLTPYQRALGASNDDEFGEGGF